MSDKTFIAIIILVVVVAVLGAPFALNEYSKYQEHEQIRQYLNRPITIQQTYSPTKTVITTKPTPTPTIQHKITDGYWCQNSIMGVEGKGTQNVKECYQFFSDGSYTHGNSLDTPMKGVSGWSWRVDSYGNYQIWGYNSNGVPMLTEIWTLNDNKLGSYSWSSTGL
jgi:hypothetical protein